MLHKKWILGFLIIGGSAGLCSHVSAQCLLHPMQAAHYSAGQCHGMQFQQATGQLFTAYGSCGGVNFTSPLTDTDQMTGISEEHDEPLIRIYPNPVHDYLFIDARDISSGQIRMYSFIGHLIFQETFHQMNPFTIDLSSFPDGAYLIKLIPQDQKSSTYTIIKS